MATLPDNHILSSLSGKLGDILFKRYKGKTVVAMLPSKKNKKTRKPGPLKTLYENSFAAGVKYAQAILRDPEKKKTYDLKTRPGQSAYHYAISEYAELYGVKPDQPRRKV